MEDKTSSKLKSMLDSKKIRNIIIVVGLIGIGLIFLSNWVDFGSLTSGKGDEAFSVKTYSTKIENDLHTYTSVYRNGTEHKDTWVADNNNTGWFTESEYYAQ